MLELLSYVSCRSRGALGPLGFRVVNPRGLHMPDRYFVRNRQVSFSYVSRESRTRRCRREQLHSVVGVVALLVVVAVRIHREEEKTSFSVQDSVYRHPRISQVPIKPAPAVGYYSPVCQILAIFAKSLDRAAFVIFL